MTPQDNNTIKALRKYTKREGGLEPLRPAQDSHDRISDAYWSQASKAIDEEIMGTKKPKLVKMVTTRKPNDSEYCVGCWHTNPETMNDPEPDKYPVVCGFDCLNWLEKNKPEMC